ncbi:endo alpha-1,4 polygalactosaminidase [Tropicimonas sp. IMCC6043]|uniref:endo alpha-1,4 polygalactosaminidase n=1 Tax=Tropicimonas sp. IMCC6043 TaxID=2510645 RepID=UPI00101D1AC5|nr:endo alpha-1,4 polygalactosaminidase [Tropicimonas sp. IMCC6043]RYH11097.1 endo alpha-1,4 polygalactosaminidase [Tropicimonas sp. IMCC6043]
MIRGLGCAFGLAVALLPPLAALAGPHDIPGVGAYWDWQLTEPFDLGVDVRVIDLDPDSVTKADIARLKARGIKTVCYVSVGTLEDYRADVAAFPAGIVGKTYGDWPDERFLDIRRRDVLLPLMRARFQKCKALGFDAIEPDNVDLYQLDTGFGITAREQVAYLRELAAMARSLGLEIAQKNAPELIGVLATEFDFLVLESCHEYGFCDLAKPYLEAGKDVLACEYATPPPEQKIICTYGEQTGIHFIFKDWDLTAGGRAC